ncbi:MAG: DUF5915 domain-containing protein, partial [bacterium]|nr:DUF5915 domain-containing protein [bacterium]
AREFIRSLQDLRKKAGLSPSDTISLTVDTSDEGKNIIDSFKTEITKTAQVTGIVYASLLEGFGEHIEVNEITFKVQIVK